MPAQRILVIEDDYDVAEMLLMYFGSHKYEIFHAEDGRVGIEMARTHYPSVILLDVMLPHMDGYEVCRRLRTASLTKYIPIIFLTQRDERADKVRGLELGADDYITKPFDVDELRLRVEGSMRRAARSSLHEARSGLPTGPLIEAELAQRRENGDSYHELRLGIEGLSAYRDVYGFIAADEAFAFAARCIKEVVSQHGTGNDFVGVVEDHFIILTHINDVQALQNSIKTQFSAGIVSFYNFLDAERGGVIVNPGTPQETVKTLMSLYPMQATV